MRQGLKLCILLVGFFVLSACQSGDGPEKAVAVIHPTQGNQFSGVVTFTQEAKGIRIMGAFKSNSGGKHGFHIHQYGDCSKLDGTSAGGHYNPESMSHGSPEKAVRHVGDLGNIVLDETASGVIDRVDPKLSLSGIYSIIGRAVIVHEREDDYQSQPTGAAGKRIGCGVIGIARNQ